jgi:hypothetical protein
MSQGALDPGGAELCRAPRELNDCVEGSAARVCRRVDKRAPERAKELRVPEDEGLTLRMGRWPGWPGRTRPGVQRLRRASRARRVAVRHRERHYGFE